MDKQNKLSVYIISSLYLRLFAVKLPKSLLVINMVSFQSNFRFIYIGSIPDIHYSLKLHLKPLAVIPKHLMPIMSIEN